jgi:hypothetical protein
MAERITEALSPARYEPRDVGAGFMLILLSGIGATLLALIALAYVMFPREVQDRRFARPFPVFPAPRLQPDPPGDWRAFHDAELRRLNGIGWMDRGRGIVHIPIDRAMRDVAAAGIPGWPTYSMPQMVRR